MPQGPLLWGKKRKNMNLLRFLETNVSDFFTSPGQQVVNCENCFFRVPQTILPQDPLSPKDGTVKSR